MGYAEKILKYLNSRLYGTALIDLLHFRVNLPWCQRYNYINAVVVL